MENKLNDCNRRVFESYQAAVKDLEVASKIAMKLGVYPGEVDKMKQQEIQALKKIYLNR